MIRLAVFASGTGTNAINFIHYFSNHPSICIVKIYCNNPKAGIIASSKSLNTECNVFTKDEWVNGTILDKLLKDPIDYIVLAGFLWLVPADIIRAYPNRIFNIHPALLPDYGGKGMYGAHVHQQIIKDKQIKSGITIHLVNEQYDKGEIIFQAAIPLSSEETAESLADKIHTLEQANYPKTVENFIIKA